MNLPSILRLEGVLSASLLHKTLQQLVYRQEVLRMRVTEKDGRYYQSFRESMDLDLPVIDLSHWDRKLQEAHIEKVFEEALQPFEFQRQPMFHVRLYRLDTCRHLLALNFHHIVADGWAVSLVLQEISKIYNGMIAEQSPQLPKLERHYADYCLWHRERLKQPVMAAQVAYWKHRLVGMDLAMKLPTRNPLPENPGFQAARHFFKLEQKLSDRVMAFTKDEGVSPFSVALAALKILINHHGGSRDITVGASYANRAHADVGNMVGVFSNLHPLRIQLEPHKSYRDIITEVNTIATEAYDHQELPPICLDVDDLDEDDWMEEIYPVIFKYQSTPPMVLFLNGLKVGFVQSKNLTAANSLVLTMWATHGYLEGYLGYRIELFEPETISGMTEHFKQLFQDLVDDPDKKPINM